MQKNQNDINTFSIFDNNNEGKNLENIETNMEMEIEPEQENNDKKNSEEDNKEENPKKESKEKRKVRGPNKCYRIIDQFFKDIKRAKELNDTEQQDQKNNKDQEEKKTRRRTKITNMSSVFDEYLNFVEPKVNNDYYNKFVLNIINNYKEFYIEKEKEFKENKSLFNNNIDDENLIRKKKIYGLENFLEIPEIVNDFMKFIYNKNIFENDEDKIEMIENIFIFCVWLKQNHYTSYNVEYLLKKEE
jgi:hypothetical protein